MPKFFLALALYGIGSHSWAINKKPAEYMDFASTKIPLECGLLIFSHASLGDIYSLSTVCKSFNAAFNNEVLWEYFYYKMLYWDDAQKIPALSWKNFLKKRVYLNHHIMRMNQWHKHAVKNALSDYQFNLWKLDLLHNNSMILKPFQFTHNDRSQDNAICFLIAYYVVYIKTPFDIAQEFAANTKSQESVSDWELAYKSVQDIINEPTIAKAYHAMSKTNVDAVKNELRAAFEKHFFPEQKLSDEGITQHWRLYNLYFLAYLTRPRIRINFFKPIFIDVLDALDKIEGNTLHVSFDQLPSVVKILTMRDNFDIRFLVLLLNHSKPSENTDKENDTKNHPTE